jgi:hypothetical protein
MSIVNYNIHANQYKVNKSVAILYKMSIINYNIHANQYKVNKSVAIL